MRSLPENVRRLILSGNYSLGITASISDASGLMKPLTGYDGEDILLSASWDTNIDTQVQQIGLTSTANGKRFPVRNLLIDTPVNSGSAMIALNRAVEVFVQLSSITNGIVLHSMSVFKGHVTEFDDSGDINITALDPLGKLADQFIEVEATYGTTAGVDISEVIIQILRANGQNVLADNFRVIGNPGYAIKPYIQKKEPVLTAIQTLVQLIGWDIRMRFDDVTQGWRMTLYEPDRTSGVIAMVFGTVVSWLALRLQGIYLALATIAFVECLGYATLDHEIFGTATGIINIPQPFDTQIEYLWIAVPVMVLSMIFLFRLERSRVGRALLAIQEDELAASATGIRPCTVRDLAIDNTRVSACTASQNMRQRP